jgi:uncharacterized protein
VPQSAALVVDRPVIARPGFRGAKSQPIERDGRIIMDRRKQDEIEAAAFRRLLQHLDSRKDVQNIDLMNLAGFCRNCLSRWYREAAQAAGVEVTDEAARERVYGMPYLEWKQLHQKEASAEQKAGFQQQKKE